MSFEIWAKLSGNKIQPFFTIKNIENGRFALLSKHFALADKTHKGACGLIKMVACPSKLFPKKSTENLEGKNAPSCEQREAEVSCIKPLKKSPLILPRFEKYTTKKNKNKTPI